MAIFDGKLRLKGINIELRVSELRQSLLLAELALVVVAMRAIEYVRGGPRPISWRGLTGDVLTTVAAFVLAAVLLRLVDLVVLRRERTDRAKRSQMLSEEIRQHLHAPKHSADGGQEPIDPTALIERALRHDD
jgi:hypothetical protein